MRILLDIDRESRWLASLYDLFLIKLMTICCVKVPVTSSQVIYGHYEIHFSFPHKRIYDVYKSIPTSAPAASQVV